MKKYSNKNNIHWMGSTAEWRWQRKEFVNLKTDQEKLGSLNPEKVGRNRGTEGEKALWSNIRKSDMYVM